MEDESDSAWDIKPSVDAWDTAAGTVVKRRLELSTHLDFDDPMWPAARAAAVAGQAAFDAFIGTTYAAVKPDAAAWYLSLTNAHRNLLRRGAIYLV
jgi:hypothetical protein